MKVWRPFEEAREFIRSLKLKNKNEWKQYCESDEKPVDIPSLPDKIYRNKGWNGYLDWLGNEAKRNRKLWLEKYFLEEHQGKMSKAQKGRKHSKETRRKMSVAKRGR